ncbi:hypothetical protein SS50377_26725 [Spironucleus salmonicida]|uniref:Uncharacterized protein n=1 Tax=Spironucleus salmonicida TaxID=348837 RepID=V6LZN0_9EUKA|nr:hypothetical protein SS50377_26725 [Spironucleus salmonicida]|eukprot:EST49196.1 Hypothetical protein SS50377_10412 [Spironucleus salmonicida]
MSGQSSWQKKYNGAQQGQQQQQLQSNNQFNKNKQQQSFGIPSQNIQKLPGVGNYQNQQNNQQQSRYNGNVTSQQQKPQQQWLGQQNYVNNTSNQRFQAPKPQIPEQVSVFKNAQQLSQQINTFGIQNQFNQVVQSNQPQVLYQQTVKAEISSGTLDDNDFDMKVRQADQDYQQWVDGQKQLDCNFILRVFI